MKLFLLLFLQTQQNLNVGHVQYLSPQEAEDQYMDTL